MIDFRKKDVIMFSINPVTGGIMNVLGYGAIIGALGNKVQGGYVAMTSKATYSNVTRSEELGKYYYKYIKDGSFIHHFGIDKFDHYILLPKTFLAETHHVDKVEVVDEETEEITTTDVIVTNGDYYKNKHVSDTYENCLIKLTDDNYSVFEAAGLITYGSENGFDNVPQNLRCSDKYDEEIETNFKTIIEEEI